MKKDEIIAYLKSTLTNIGEIKEDVACSGIFQIKSFDQNDPHDLQKDYINFVIYPAMKKLTDGVGIRSIDYGRVEITSSLVFENEKIKDIRDMPIVFNEKNTQYQTITFPLLRNLGANCLATYTEERNKMLPIKGVISALNSAELLTNDVAKIILANKARLSENPWKWIRLFHFVKCLENANLLTIASFNSLFSAEKDFLLNSDEPQEYFQRYLQSHLNPNQETLNRILECETIDDLKDCYIVNFFNAALELASILQKALTKEECIQAAIRRGISFPFATCFLPPENITELKKLITILSSKNYIEIYEKLDFLRVFFGYEKELGEINNMIFYKECLKLFLGNATRYHWATVIKSENNVFYFIEKHLSPLMKEQQIKSEIEMQDALVEQLVEHERNQAEDPLSYALRLYSCL